MIRTTHHRSRKAGIWMKLRDPLALRRWRKRAGYTQSELGALCKCSQTTIHLLESGKLLAITEDLALTIARRLGVPWEDLFEARECLHVPGIASSKERSHRGVA